MSQILTLTRSPNHFQDFTQPGGTDTSVQFVISLLLGFSAFFAFCVSLLSVYGALCLRTAQLLTRPRSTGSQAKMEDTVCCEKATIRPGV